jgi:hypothetical protein
VPLGTAVTLVLPSGTLVALSAPPVGGPRAADPPAQAAPDRLVLNDAAAPSAEGGVRFAVLSDGDLSPADVSFGAGRMGSLPSPAAQLLRLLERLAVDLLFRGGGVSQWLHDLTIPSLPPPAAADPGTEEEPPADEPAPADDGAWVGGLLAAASLAVALGDARRRNDSREDRVR